MWKMKIKWCKWRKEQNTNILMLFTYIAATEAENYKKDQHKHLQHIHENDSTWILAPRYTITPGMQVNVVNS